MSIQMKLGIIFGLILLVGISLFMFKVIVKLGALLMFVGGCFIFWQMIKFLFFRKKG